MLHDVSEGQLAVVVHCLKHEVLGVEVNQSVQQYLKLWEIILLEFSLIVQTGFRALTLYKINLKIWTLYCWIPKKKPNFYKHCTYLINMYDHQYIFSINLLRINNRVQYKIVKTLMAAIPDNFNTYSEMLKFGRHRVWISDRKSCPKSKLGQTRRSLCSSPSGWTHCRAWYSDVYKPEASWTSKIRTSSDFGATVVHKG